MPTLAAATVAANLGVPLQLEALDALLQLVRRGIGPRRHRPEIVQARAAAAEAAAALQATKRLRLSLPEQVPPRRQLQTHWISRRHVQALGRF